MERIQAILLKVWQEACRHIEIGQCAQRIGPLLAEELPLEQFVIREVIPGEKVIETAAMGFPVRDEWLYRRKECPQEVMNDLVAWAQAGGVVHADAGGAPLSRELVGDKVDREVFCGSLGCSEPSFGVLVLIARKGEEFNGKDTQLVQALLSPLEAAWENDRRLREMGALRKAAEADKRSLLVRLGRERLGDTIVGCETGLREVMERVDLVAGSAAPVLILGETGAGKELIARAIHERSSRSDRAFLRVNCGAIPTDLVDSQLFGHEKGAFTGAVATRPGWFERADGGTLFLDEVGELPAAAQVRLLRVLQDGWMERVGSDQPIHVDVRVVAATNRDLPAMVAAGTFREDLWYRIAVFPIVLPPLRQRRQDIAGLAGFFAERAAKRFGLRSVAPTPGDVGLLEAYDWPGNVREFAAVIDRAAILGNGQRLEIAKALGFGNEGLRVSGKPPAGQPSPDDGRGDMLSLADVMRAHIEEALRRAEGRVEGPHGVARMLNVNPHTLRARMRKLGIDWTSFRTHCGSTL